MHRPTRLALALPVLLTALLAPPTSDACMNEVERVVDTTNQAIRAAEDLLARGNHQSATRVVSTTFPKVLVADHQTRRQDLFDRGQRIVALALVRSGGTVKLGKLTGKTEADRDTAVAWAASTLRLQAARGDGSVLLTSELAEALALRPAERHEAHTLLKDLADADVVPTARAWAVLASLEQQRGDTNAAARAVARCKDIAADDSTCDAADVS
jgi:hypothetical protein